MSTVPHTLGRSHRRRTVHSVIARKDPLQTLSVSPRPPGGIALAGQFDIAGVRVFTRQVENWTCAQDVVVDLSELAFIDAAGLGALIGFRNALRAADRRMQLRHPVPRVRRAFTAARLDHLIAP